MQNPISICIPTYEYQGQGVKFLKDLFASIRRQNFKDFDIVISDHSLNDEIELFCKSQAKLTINYFRNENGRGSGASNTNNAIKLATGEILKILYQDDFFVHDRALAMIHASFSENKDQIWLMHGFAHGKNTWLIKRRKIPQWNENLLIGQNAFGSPSCLAFRNSHKRYMDENLKLLVDTELYHRLILEFGMPGILPDTLIANREHKRRISYAAIDYNLEITSKEAKWRVDKREYDYVVQKHKFQVSQDITFKSL